MTEKKRKKISRRYLENAGVFYLNRFASSEKNFRRVMQRKIENSLSDHPEQNKDECLEMLEDTIRKFSHLGYLDDTQYTRQSVSSLRKQGKSKRAIISKLRQKGIPPELVEREVQRQDKSLSDASDGTIDPELLSALKHCRKKRIGPFHPDSSLYAEDADILKRHLGRLARAGFDYPTARKALQTSSEKARSIFDTSSCDGQY